MSDQNFRERFNTSYMGERIEKDTNGPVANSDPPTDEASVEAALIHETPSARTITRSTREQTPGGGEQRTTHTTIRG